MSENNKNINEKETINENVASEISQNLQSNPAPETKPKKPKKPWTIKRVLGLAAAALAIFLVANIIVGLLQGPDPIFVQTQTVALTDVNQTLSTSGSIATAEMVTVFSPVHAPIENILIEKGRLVQEGELMFEFNTKDLERSYRQASSAAAIAGAQANQSRDTSKSNQSTVDSLKQEISDINERISKIEAAIKALEIEAGAGSPASPSIDSSIPSSTVPPEAPPISEESSDASTASVAFFTQCDPAAFEQTDTVADEIAILKNDKNLLEKKRAELEVKLDAASKGILDANGNTIVNNQGVPSYIAFETAKENLAAGKAGVVAPISGVVTNMSVVKGGLSAQYSIMCTIESIEKVDVIVSLSRFDLENVKDGQKGTIETGGKEYSATISQIDSMATLSATGSYVFAKISIDKPDNNIRLGLEAKVKIATGVAKNVLAVPIGAINTDVDGVYCYIFQEGVAVKREVTLGMSNDSTVEVKSGLAENDIIILNPQDVHDGAIVTNDPTNAPAQGMFTIGIG